MTVKDLHREAMRFNDLALIAKLEGDIENVRDNYLKAFEFEKQAFILFNSESSEEPTRSILIRSAANLAFLSDKLREAEKFISLGLAGDPPEELASEFRDLLQRVNFHRHLELHGTKLSTNELQLSLSGNQVSHGIIRSDEFMNRIDIIEKLAFRTSDRIRNKPFKEKGRPDNKNVKNFEPYLSVPRAASFAITIRFGEQPDQPTFEGMDLQGALIDDILKNIELINQNNFPGLAENIKDEAYRRNFIALTKNLAPDGDRIKLVGFTTTRNENIESVALTKTSKTIELTPSEDEKALQSQSSVEVKGQLSYADAKRNKIKLTDHKNNVDYIVEVPSGLLSDIVKPHFEEIVVVRGVKKGKTIRLIDIEKAQ